MTNQALLADARVAAAIHELKELIRARYPSARFDVSSGSDPGEVYLVVTVDSEDSDDVMAVYIDRLVELQVDERLPLYVMTLRPTPTVNTRTPSQTANHETVA